MSTCASCTHPLYIEIPADSETGSSSLTQKVPDDVHLPPCNHHFHWSCLLQNYQIEQCSVCQTSLVTFEPPNNQPVLRVNLHNEGGLQQDIDIFPLLREEQYLRAYPEERKARAFMEFVREGDLAAICEMITAGDEDEDDADEDDEMADNDSEEDDEEEADVKQQPLSTLLRYQDPLSAHESALHAAVRNGHREVAWLLLLMASSLDLSQFPAAVFQEASGLGIMRPEGVNEEHKDIRSLRDAVGKSAEDVARESEAFGQMWGSDGWVGSGRLVI